MQCCDRQYSRRERWICSVNLTAIMHFLRDAVSPKYFQWALWRQSASHDAMPRSGNNRKRGTPRWWSRENRECVLTMYLFLFLIPPFLHPPQNFTSWAIPPCVCKLPYICPGGRFKNTYELLNLRALKFSKLHKNHIFQCMGKIFCVEFQRVPLKFHTKYLTHTLKDVDFIHIWKFKSSLI